MILWTKTILMNILREMWSVHEHIILCSLLLIRRKRSFNTSLRKSAKCCKMCVTHAPAACLSVVVFKQKWHLICKTFILRGIHERAQRKIPLDDKRFYRNLPLEGVRTLFCKRRRSVIRNSQEWKLSYMKSWPSHVLVKNRNR